MPSSLEWKIWIGKCWRWMHKLLTWRVNWTALWNLIINLVIFFVQRSWHKCFSKLIGCPFHFWFEDIFYCRNLQLGLETSVNTKTPPQFIHIFCFLKGAVYTRWGRATCPEVNGTTILYSGKLCEFKVVRQEQNEDYFFGIIYFYYCISMYLPHFDKNIFVFKKRKKNRILIQFKWKRVVLSSGKNVHMVMINLKLGISQNDL